MVNKNREICKSYSVADAMRENDPLWAEMFLHMSEAALAATFEGLREDELKAMGEQIIIENPDAYVCTFPREVSV